MRFWLKISAICVNLGILSANIGCVNASGSAVEKVLASEPLVGKSRFYFYETSLDSCVAEDGSLGFNLGEPGECSLQADGNLPGADFSGANLRGADFRRANLANTNFDHADLTGANFQDANLLNASFQNAALDRTRWTRTILDPYYSPSPSTTPTQMVPLNPGVSSSVPNKNFEALKPKDSRELSSAVADLDRLIAIAESASEEADKARHLLFTQEQNIEEIKNQMELVSAELDWLKQLEKLAVLKKAQSANTIPTSKEEISNLKKQIDALEVELTALKTDLKAEIVILDSLSRNSAFLETSEKSALSEIEREEKRIEHLSALPSPVESTDNGKNLKEQKENLALLTLEMGDLKSDLLSFERLETSMLNLVAQEESIANQFLEERRRLHTEAMDTEKTLKRDRDELEEISRTWASLSDDQRDKISSAMADAFKRILNSKASEIDFKRQDRVFGGKIREQNLRLKKARWSLKKQTHRVRQLRQMQTELELVLKALLSQ